MWCESEVCNGCYFWYSIACPTSFFDIFGSCFRQFVAGSFYWMHDWMRPGGGLPLALAIGIAHCGALFGPAAVRVRSGSYYSISLLELFSRALAHAQIQLPLYAHYATRCDDLMS